LKNSFIEILYKKGFCTKVFKHVRKLDAQVCWACDATGLYTKEGDLFLYDEECYRCKGTGIYRPAKTLTWFVFYFVISDQYFVWHQPQNLVKYSINLTDDFDTDINDTEVKPIEIPKKKLTESKALVKWFLEM